MRSNLLWFTIGHRGGRITARCITRYWIILIDDWMVLISGIKVLAANMAINANEWTNTWFLTIVCIIDVLKLIDDKFTQCSNVNYIDNFSDNRLKCELLQFVWMSHEQMTNERTTITNTRMSFLKCWENLYYFVQFVSEFESIDD